MPTLHKRALVALSLSISLVATAAATPAAAAPRPGAAVLTAATQSPEQQVFALLNKQRTAAGRSALVGQHALDVAAEAWAKHLATTGTFAHSSSTWRMSKIGYWGWKSSGENLAAGYATAAAAVSAWMKSSGHKANILSKAYKGMGIGYYKAGPYKHYWVVIFAVADPPIPKGTTPKVSGTAKIGATMKATSTGWPSGTSLHWQWYRNGVAIAGATASTYKATTSDQGKSLRAKVAAYNSRYYPTGLYSPYTLLVAV